MQERAAYPPLDERDVMHTIERRRYAKQPASRAVRSLVPTARRRRRQDRACVDRERSTALRLSRPDAS